ncbi:MAG: phasin family protein [Burkholderiales bacterium]|nr:phasin family protein [Burkholderiales bacterium]
MRTTEMRGNYVFNAYRQVWLAGLGAAVVTRDWAQAEAGPLFRNLVKEGTLVESRTFRIVGDRIEGSVARANAVWMRARSTMSSTVRQAADTAATLVQNNLPKSLPKVTLPSMLAPAKPAKKRAAKPVRTAKVRKAVKRKARKAK